MRILATVMGTALGLLAGVAVLLVVASSVHTGDYLQVSTGGGVALLLGMAAVPLSAAFGGFLGWKATARRG